MAMTIIKQMIMLVSVIEAPIVMPDRKNSITVTNRANIMRLPITKNEHKLLRSAAY
jgi:hypothetical protein